MPMRRVHFAPVTAFRACECWPSLSSSIQTPSHEYIGSSNRKDFSNSGTVSAPLSPPVELSLAGLQQKQDR